MVSPCHPVHADERAAAHIAQTGNRITRDISSFKEELAAFRKGLARLPKAMRSYRAEFHKRDCKSQMETLDKAIAILDSTLKG